MGEGKEGSHFFERGGASDSLFICDSSGDKTGRRGLSCLAGTFVSGPMGRLLSMGSGIGEDS